MNSEQSESGSPLVPVPRRSVLAAAGTAAAAFGSGCVGNLLGESETVRIQMTVQNLLPEPHVIQVLIVEESDTEPVFWKAYDLGPYDTASETEKEAGVRVEEIPPVSRAETTIYAKTQAEPDVSSLSLAEYGQRFDCIEVDVETERPAQQTERAFVEYAGQCSTDAGAADS